MSQLAKIGDRIIFVDSLFSLMQAMLVPKDVLARLDFRSPHQIGSPRKLIAILFIVEFSTFTIFLVCLALRCLEHVVPQTSLVTESVISETVSFDSTTLSNIDSIREYVLTFPLAILNASDHDEKSSLFLQSHRLLGALVFSQTRSFMSECVRWGTAFDCVSSGDRSSGQPFEGILARAPVQVFLPDKACPSVLCDPGFRSALSWTYYEAGGATLLAFGGSLFASSNSSFSSNLTSDTVSSFIDRFTRFLSISGTLLDGEGLLLTSFSLNFELPVVGGSFAWIDTRTVQVEESSLSQQYAGVVWFYCAAFLFVSIWRSAMGVINRQACDVCNSSDGFISTNCSSCRKPVCLDILEVTRCSWCGLSLQAPQHGCWKAQLDFTRVVPLLNIISIVVASAFEQQAQNALQTTVSTFLATPQLSPPMLDVLAPIDQLSRVGTMNAFNILIAFVSLYRFLGRAPWIARFLRVFGSGGFLMAFFFLGFAAVFVGFMLSFYLLLGETSATFATASGAFTGTFQLLLGLVDWDTVSTYLFSSSFTALYLFFCWVCVLVMVNVLISLVTAEYKRSRKVQSFDVETESCKLLFSRGDQASTNALSNLVTEHSEDESRKAVEDMNLTESRVLPLIDTAKVSVDHMESSLSVMESDARHVRRSAEALEKLSSVLQSLQ